MSMKVMSTICIYKKTVGRFLAFLVFIPYKDNWVFVCFFISKNTQKGNNSWRTSYKLSRGNQESSLVHFLLASKR